MDLTELEQRHKLGVQIIRERGYYDRLISEAHLMIKYIDNQFFLKLFSENLFDDLRGVFTSFIRQDLRSIYQEIVSRPDVPITVYLEREYMSLTILQKCTTNLRYQVKSLVRMKKVKSLEFKSSFLQAVSRKLHGEVQDLYHLLATNYKQYFRMQFTRLHQNEDRVSLKCIDNLSENFDSYFTSVMNRFYQLSDAILFVKEMLHYEIEVEIRNRIAALFFDRQEKMERIIDYFITDLKRNFIKTMERHMRSGRDFEWIEKGFNQFIQSTRFEALSRRIINQTLSMIRETHPTKTAADIF